MKQIFKIGAATVLAVAATAIPTLGIASPASAGCSTNVFKTWIDISGSTKFEANSGCDGVWADRAAQVRDAVRGRFHKDGAWQTSTYGYVTVYPGVDSDVPKIVGNTTNGRHIKGQSHSTGQGIWYKY